MSSRAASRRAASARPGATAGPPALGNAIYAATGIALRRLPIDREVLAGRKHGMKDRGLLGIARVAIVVVIAGACCGLDRAGAAGPRTFAGGGTVALADYKAGESHRRAAGARRAPTGRARRISGAGGRLRSLPHRPGRPALRRRLRLRPAVRHALFDEHHARQADRHRQLDATRNSSTPCTRASRADGARLYPALPYASYT